MTPPAASPPATRQEETWRFLPKPPEQPKTRLLSVLTGYRQAMEWVWLIIVGAIVGALGRLLHPGRDPMGWIVTILIGVASLVIAGLIFSSGWLQFIVGVVIAIILVWLVGRFMTSRAGPATAP